MGVNVKKMDEIVTLMDKVNQATVRGLIPQAGKEAIITSLQNEILVCLEGDKKAVPPEKKVEPPAETKPEPKK